MYNRSHYDELNINQTLLHFLFAKVDLVSNEMKTFSDRQDPKD